MRSEKVDHARLRIIDAMPPGVGEVFHALWKDVVHLHAQWETFMGLFCEGEARVELLNRTAPEFFKFVSDAFALHVLLGVARLTDPAHDRSGNENLTLELLAGRVEQAGEEDLAGRLRQRLEAVSVMADCIRQNRNKLLAHSDATVRLAENRSELVPGITVDEVNKALSEIRAFMHAVEYELGGRTTTLYTDTVSGQILAPLLSALEAVPRDRRQP